MLEKIHLVNFKKFQDATIEFNSGMNIIVGDNESGKSTLLEAIYLALTSRLAGKFIGTEVSSHLFNQDTVTQYVADIAAGSSPTPPEILIDLFLVGTKETAKLRGTNNSLGENAPGVRIKISFNQDFAPEYMEFVKEKDKVKNIPCEDYHAEWTSFSGASITYRSLNLGVSMIDASRIRLQSGSDYYLQRIIADNLTDKQRVELARAYRNLKEEFAKDESIAIINKFLDDSKDSITDKNFSVSIDVSSTSAWESSLAPHLDDLPLHHAGSGEQNMLKILLALARTIDDSHLILIEEPENHLSFSSLNRLVSKIQKKCADRQIIITTHSSYVINKLGLEQLMLLNGQTVTKLEQLPADTQAYFKKLSGYDTLRIVLAKKVILVEGPSDELIVQRAYLDAHGVRPIEQGVDVINIRGLSFKRFLDIATLLGRDTVVVTDNDGDPAAVDAKYADYASQDCIKICRSDDATLKTLEPQLAACNELVALNSVLDKTFGDKESLIDYMTKDGNKTDCALLIFDSPTSISMPAYITKAVGG